MKIIRWVSRLIRENKIIKIRKIRHLRVLQGVVSMLLNKPKENRLWWFGYVIGEPKDRSEANSKSVGAN